MLRLQQILFYRELEFSLGDIQDLLHRPDFDLLHALDAHQSALQARVERLKRLIHTLEKTRAHLKGERTMTQEEYFEGWTEEKQKGYEEEIRQRYGDKAFEGVKDWNAYSKEEQEKIKAEGRGRFSAMLDHMHEGHDSPAVQAALARWHTHMRYFYEPSVERLRGLADLYNEHPEFEAMFKRMHPDFPQFLRKAIQYYCDHL